MKIKWLLMLILLISPLYGQSPTQIAQILPGTPSVNFSWSYNTADEQFMDSFVLQRTAYGTTSTITSPYDIEQVIAQKTARSITHTLPTPAPTVGQTSFYRMVARKQGLADSTPSNVVQIKIVPTPPAPQNLNIAAGGLRFTEVWFTKKNLNGAALWTISRLL